MNIRKIIPLLIALPIIVSGQMKTGDYDSMISSLCSGSVPFIDTEELKRGLDKNEDLLILDTREKKEYQVSHIPGAEWVGYESFSRSRVKDFDREAKVVVYCSVGYRSEKIGEKLEKMGFKNVFNLYGGIFDWANKENELVDQDGGETYKVHTYDSNWAQWLKKGEKVYER